MMAKDLGRLHTMGPEVDALINNFNERVQEWSKLF